MLPPPPHFSRPSYTPERQFVAVERNLEILFEILRRYCEIVRFGGSVVRP